MRAIRYSIGDLLTGVTFIACGLGLFLGASQVADTWNVDAIGYFGWFGGSATIGAGCGAPFHAKAFGMVIGVALGTVALIALFMYISTLFHR